VTVKVPEPALPAESVEVHVTVIVPTANDDPDDGEHVAGSVPLTASVAVTAGHETEIGAPAGDDWVLPPGTFTTGAVVSRTVTLNDAVPASGGHVEANGAPNEGLTIRCTFPAPAGLAWRQGPNLP
jgi:hypothetical protein